MMSQSFQLLFFLRRAVAFSGSYATGGQSFVEWKRIRKVPFANGAKMLAVPPHLVYSGYRVVEESRSITVLSSPLME